jgi:hypothetical protein
VAIPRAGRPFRVSLLLLVGALGACSENTGPEDPGNASDPVLAGGAGDQTSLAVALDGSAIYVSGPGVVARFDAASTAAAWVSTQADVQYYGVAASGGRVFVAGKAVAGTSAAPGACGASDDVGGIEQKTMAGVYDTSGGFIRCESRVHYPYSGFEDYYAATAADGQFFAAGWAQQAGVANGFPFLLARYDTDGQFEAAVTEPDLEYGTGNGCCTGQSTVWGLGRVGADVLAAGSSDLPGSGEDDVKRPMLMRYTSALTRVWKVRSTDREGRFMAAAEVGGAFYAVGEAVGASFNSYLIEKYDGTGARQWSVAASSQSILTGVVGVGGRVFAVGTAWNSDLGGTDVLVVEVDPADGSILSTTLLGGDENDAAAGVVTDGAALWVGGHTRSYPGSSGNQPGQAELALWRVPIG